MEPPKPATPAEQLLVAFRERPRVRQVAFLLISILASLAWLHFRSSQPPTPPLPSGYQEIPMESHDAGDGAADFRGVRHGFPPVRNSGRPILRGPGDFPRVADDALLSCGHRVSKQVSNSKTVLYAVCDHDDVWLWTDARGWEGQAYDH
jgi:hypothetical protein